MQGMSFLSRFNLIYDALQINQKLVNMLFLFNFFFFYNKKHFTKDLIRIRPSVVTDHCVIYKNLEMINLIMMC